MPLEAWMIIGADVLAGRRKKTPPDRSRAPTVVCGPGSIDQAHKPDEYVTLEQLALCERFMTRLLDRVSAA